MNFPFFWNRIFLLCAVSFLTAVSAIVSAAEGDAVSAGESVSQTAAENAKLPESFLQTFREPSKEFTLMPFWFWNDTLDDAELVRQIADFEAHGVYGFVIHPRIGLPADSGWMSPKLLSAMRTALEEARKRGMYVLLYDEGMYPSGSSAGQVAAKDPRFAARGFFKVDLADGAEADPHPHPLWDLVAVFERPNGQRSAVYERPSGGVIRGLHYLDEGTPKQREFLPPAGDILSPDAAACFRELVYERFYEEFGEYFGTTVLGIFTDEPSELGRGASRGVIPGNVYALKKVSERLGYDFTPYLADLWFKDSPDSASRRSAYYRALHFVLIDTYYRPLSEWCVKHGIALCGHSGNSNDMVSQTVFQIPGQDIVWRYVEPGHKALNGAHSTNAKTASSAMTHFGRTRNLNELYGAYGHNLTFEEVKWLANWILVRGQNLLVPHAFYYSVRGPRHDERPPDVGPNSPWWNDGFKPYADACRRICWLNSGTPVIHTAILTDGAAVQDFTVKPLFENQLDFNYLEMEQLLREGRVDDEGLHLAGMTYRAVVAPVGDNVVPPGFWESETVRRLEKDGRLVRWDGRNVPGYVEKIRTLTSQSVSKKPGPEGRVPVRISGKNASGIRIRHILIEGTDCLLLFNETKEPAEVSLSNLPDGAAFWLNAEKGEVLPCPTTENVHFAPFEMKIWASAN